MIKEITITNFYSFNQSKLSLNNDINVLIGINGSGKSNFLKAIKLLKEGISGMGLKKHLFNDLGGFDNFFFKGATNKQEEQAIILEYRFDSLLFSKINDNLQQSEDILYQIKIVKVPSLANYYIQEIITTDKGFRFLDFTNGIGNLEYNENGRIVSSSKMNYPDFDPQELALKEINDSKALVLMQLKKAIKEIMVYDYFDTTPKSLIRKPMLPTSEKRLFADGGNLPQILNTIKINHKQSYRKIVEMLNEVNQNFSGFDFNFIGGNIELMLEETNLNSSIHVSNISDGTLRYLCLLAILYNPERGRLICIDEPEVGLHPDMILNIANAIKEAAETSMIIISTHSENLLNYFEIENVRVFEKDKNNATNVLSYTKKQFSAWYEEFSLGQMWKQGDLGGVRYGS